MLNLERNLSEKSKSKAICILSDLQMEMGIEYEYLLIISFYSPKRTRSIGIQVSNVQIIESTLTYPGVDLYNE